MFMTLLPEKPQHSSQKTQAFLSNKLQVDLVILASLQLISNDLLPSFNLVIGKFVITRFHLRSGTPSKKW